MTIFRTNLALNQLSERKDNTKDINDATDRCIEPLEDINYTDDEEKFENLIGFTAQVLKQDRNCLNPRLFIDLCDTFFAFLKKCFFVFFSFFTFLMFLPLFAFLSLKCAVVQRVPRQYGRVPRAAGRTP